MFSAANETGILRQRPAACKAFMSAITEMPVNVFKSDKTSPKGASFQQKLLGNSSLRRIARSAASVHCASHWVLQLPAQAEHVAHLAPMHSLQSPKSVAKNLVSGHVTAQSISHEAVLAGISRSCVNVPAGVCPERKNAG